MSAILQVTNLFKHYDSFTLDHVSLSVEGGCITGFIGSNGAGKTTTIKAILGLIRADGGSISLFGETITGHEITRSVKERLGVVFDTCPFPNASNINDIAHLGQTTYHSWNKALFNNLLERFQLKDHKQPIKDLSRGMGMKLQLAFALAHQPNLLILDEATAGLDPLARDEALILLREFISDEEHGILMSSHITSDLEKIADHIVCIDHGKICFTEERDVICDFAGIAHCRSDQVPLIIESKLFPSGTVRILRSTYHTDILVPDRLLLQEHLPTIPIDRASLEDYMRFMLKGEMQ